MFKAKVHYGSYDSQGNWYHNPSLDMSREEQLKAHLNQTLNNAIKLNNYLSNKYNH